MVQDIISKRLSELVGTYVSERVKKEIQAEPYQDENGNYVGKCTPTIKFILGGLILVSYLLSVTLPSLKDVLGIKPLMYLCYFLFVEAVLLTLLTKKKLFYRYILTKDALVIKKIFGTKKIPYSEFKEAGNTFPPMLYGVTMIYTSKSEIIRLDYTYLMGGVKFILYFSEFIGNSLDDDLAQEVLKRVHRNSALASREEKKELKRRKKYVRENIC